MQTTILSYGGGVQSVATLVLIAQRLLPVPDLIVFADTGREATATWRYLEQHAQPLAARFGRVINIASHDLSPVDLYSHQGAPLMPLYVGQHGGQLRTFCSVEWKRRVVQRWVRAMGVQQGEFWVGFSTDEYKRATLRPDAQLSVPQ